MHGRQELSPLPAAEGSGRSAMEEKRDGQSKKEHFDKSINVPSYQNDEASSPPSPQPPKAGKRARQSRSSTPAPYLHPLPTIETIMTYPSLSRPTYDSLVSGEPPAPTYNTVIHVPKPPNMRVLDENLLRSAEMQAQRRRRKRARSATTSTTDSSASGYSGGGSTESSSFTPSSSSGESETSTSEVSAPSSPTPSISSTSKATISSSPPGTPHWSLFPALASPTPSTGSNIINAYSDPPSCSSSPLQSFHSTVSTLSTLYNNSSSSLSSSCTSSSSTRSSAPSPSSSAYPSPPASPQSSRRSSSSNEEYMAYPSPPPSPDNFNAPHHPAQRTEFPQTSQSRDRRAFTFPLPQPSLIPTTHRPTAPRRLRLTRSTSLSSHPYTSFPTLSAMPSIPDVDEYNLGERTLGGGNVDDHEGSNPSPEDMAWSMNGGKLVFTGNNDGPSTNDKKSPLIVNGSTTISSINYNGVHVEYDGNDDVCVCGDHEAHEEEEEEVVYGAAGVAMSPRALKRSSNECACELHGGLGLYIIDEVEEEEDEGVEKHE